MTSLVIIEHDNDKLNDATLRAISAGAQCSQKVELLLMTTKNFTVALVEQCSTLAGINKIWLAESEVFEHSLAEIEANQVVQLQQQENFSHILWANTAHGKNTAPRLAALLDCSQISEIISVVDENTFDRPIYAGNAIARVQSADTCKVLTVRSTAFRPVERHNKLTVALEQVSPVSPSDLVQFGTNQKAVNSRPELTSAKVIVSGGRALGSSEAFMQLLAPLADKLGAALGASRAAVDSGYAPNDWQVGQTGKVVAPEVYIACGISGAIQHLAGMKDSRIIIAINKDPEAPIFSIADFGLHADIFSAVPELISLL